MISLPKNLLLIFITLLACDRCRGEFEPIVGWDSQVFPSYVVATAAMKNQSPPESTILGDAFGIFGVSVTAPSNNATIHVSVQCDGYAEPSEYVGILPVMGQTYRVFPKMRYRFDQLSQCRQATPSTAIFKVKMGSGIVEEMSCTVTMRSINDCPFAIVDGDEITTDLSHIYAAYVNEQHPYVDKLLREALDQGMVDSFTGYQSKKKADVLAQVYALWDLMVTRDVRYSSTTATAAESKTTRSQHVRLLEETVNNTQANCVDGTVLFAALLRKIGIDSALVITEDHCYLAFWTDADHKSIYGLETTMVSLQAAEMETPKEFESVVSPDLRWDVSWGSFITALNEVTPGLRAALENETPDIMLIDVNAARLAGVLPIPFTGSERFVALKIEDDDSESEDAQADASDSEESEDDTSDEDDYNAETDDVSSWKSDDERQDES